MDSYIDYIKCGEVLIAPSLDKNDQYILKCIECNECFSDISEHVAHCMGHYTQGTESEDNHSIPDIIDMFENDEVEEHEIDLVSGQDESVTIKYEYLSEAELEEEMDQVSFVDIGELVLDESDDTQNKSLTLESETQRDETNFSEMPESDEEAMDGSVDSKTSRYLRDFMNTEIYVKTIIQAYKMQPFLWNSNNPSEIRAKERPKCLQKIADEMKSKLNLSMSRKEVAAVIARLRHDYRERQKRLADCGPDGKTKVARSTILESMDFLEPFMENRSIYNLDPCLPPLTTDEILQILDIYEQLPVLWNTDLIENVCTNKRLESLTQMQKLMKSELGLAVTVSTLKKYTNCIHLFFSREKRKHLTGVTSNAESTELYRQMKFLSNHVGPFKCFQCRRAFQNPLNLKVHLSEHNGTMPLKCSLCDKEYRTTDAYMAHARRHMNDLKNECKECGKKFSRPADLEIHQRCHTGAKPYCCEVCGVSFRHSQAFTTHKRRHKKQYMHHCPVCLKGFYKKDQMNNHVKTHTDIRDINCKICGKGFKTKKTMRQHLFTHEEGRKHPCDQCGKTFKNKLGLSQHIKIHRKHDLLDMELS